MSEPTLKPCPFCGADATVNWEKETMQSVGCSKPSMLCPNPSMVIYKETDGSFDYKYWNSRVKI